MEQKSLWLNTQDSKFRGLVLLFLGIGVAITAQITLDYSVSAQETAKYFLVSQWWQGTWNDTSPIPGVFLYLLACVLFIMGVRILGDPYPALTIWTDGMERRQPKFGFWMTSVGLSGAVAIYFAIGGIGQGQDVAPAGFVLVALWITSIVLFLASVLLDENWQPPTVRMAREWIVERRGELLVIAALVIAAFFIRFLDVEYHPYSFINDEGRIGTIGLCILQGRCSNLFFMDGWSGQPYLAFLPSAIGIAIFGKTAIALRMASVITGTLSTLAVYLFAREAFGKRIAWVSAFLLVALPLHIQFSRLGVDNIIDSLSAPLLLWLLFRGAKRGSTLSFVTAGIVAGLCVYTYPGSVLAAILGTCTLIYFAVLKRGFLQAQRRNLLFFILAAVIVALPLLGNYYINPNLFMARFKGEGIFQNGMLQDETGASWRTATKILIGQFAESSLVSIATPAASGFFNSPQPYLIPLTAVLFVLGLALVVWRIKDPPYMTVFVLFWAPVILGSTLTTSPPSSQRMLMSTPALVIIVAIGAMKTVEALQIISHQVRRFVPVILLGLVIYTGLVNINFYFGEYRSGHSFEDAANEFTYETRTDIAPLHDQGRLYLIADPGVFYLTFPSFAYFEPDVEKDEFNTVTPEALAALPHDKDALFIATPDYILDLQRIEQWIPGGEWKEVKRRYQPTQMLYYSYKIKKEQLEGFKP